MLCNSSNRSAQVLSSPEGIAFQEPWKPGMASSELPRFAGKNSGRIHAFLDKQYFESVHR